MEMSRLLRNNLCAGFLAASAFPAFAAIQIDSVEAWRYGSGMEMRGILIIGTGENRVAAHHVNRANWWRVQGGESQRRVINGFYLPGSSSGSLSPSEHIYRAHNYRNR